MRQAAVFDGGLMIVLGDETSQVGRSNNLVSLPAEVLKFMFTSMQDVSALGVITLKRFSGDGITLEIGRDETGYFVVSPDTFYLHIDKSEADDLRDLILGKYSSAPGFYWPDVIAEEVL